MSLEKGKGDLSDLTSGFQGREDCSLRAPTVFSIRRGDISSAFWKDKESKTKDRTQGDDNLSLLNNHVPVQFVPVCFEKGKKEREL